jgi:hypothetical protein
MHVNVLSHLLCSILSKKLANHINETQATGIPMDRDELELAGRNEAQISQAKRIEICKPNYPILTYRDNFGSNYPPLWAERLYKTF